jgi:hypothetical protein
MHIRLLGVVALAAGVSGCGIIQLPAMDGRTRTFDGDECNEVRQTEDEAQNQHGSGEVKAAETPREKVLVAICPETEFLAHDPAGRTYGGTRYQRRRLPQPGELHAAFELRHPVAIDAASLVIETAAGQMSARGRGRGGRAAGGPVEKPFGDERAEKEETALGMAAVYATFIDPVALDQELAATQLPEAARGRYKALVAEAARVATLDVNAMKPGVRKVVFDLPLGIANALRADYTQRKQLGDLLDGLAAQADKARAGQADAAQVARDLSALRTTLFNACGATEACTYHPLYIEATHELATLYIAAKMPREARAESAVLSRKDSLRQTFQAATYAAQTDAGAKATRALETKREAGKMDAKLAKVMSTEDAVSFSFASFYRADLSMPFLASVMDGGEHGGHGQSHATQGYVQSVTPKGDRSLIEFKTEYVNDDVPVSCVRTGRIERIDRDGKIQYEEECQYRTERRALDKPAPVLVPSREGAGLKPGELLSVWVTGKEGTVFEAHEAKQGGGLTLTQLRSDRLKKPAPSVAK